MSIGAGKSLFLSCSEHDASEALRIEAFLVSQGFEVWCFKHGQCLASRFLDTIYEAADRADGFIFLLSRHSLDSTWCYDEAHYARTIEAEVILPIIIEDCPVAKNRTWRLLRQWGSDTDRRSPTEEDLQLFAVRLAEEVEKDRASKALPRIRPDEEKQPVKNESGDHLHGVLPLTERWSGNGASVLVKVDVRAPGARAVRVWLQRECADFEYGSGSWRFSGRAFESRIKPALIRLLG